MARHHTKGETQMSNIKHSITELVGHTPLLELVNYEKAHGIKAHLLAKLEYFNPTGSVKDRVALSMIEAAEREGRIHPGDLLVDTTSGNTGISEAAFAAAKGYQLEEIIEDGTTIEREQILRAYGVTFKRTSEFPEIMRLLMEKGLNVPALAEYMENYCAKKGAFFLGQVVNPHNPEIHRLTTGPEIWEDTDGHVDAVVCMIGTSGTISGLSEYLRPLNPAIHIVAVDPAKQSRPTPEHPNVNIIDGTVAIEDMPVEGRAPFMPADAFDERVDVVTEDAYVTARELARYDGLLIGTSAAAATLAATRIAKRPEFEGKNIVIIMADNAFKYLSTPIFRGEK
jgi:cysteine synthase A